MRRRRDRPFSILDGMILVAATGVGLALGKTIIHDVQSMPVHPMWIARPVSYFLLAWTLAFLPIRLRRPRPSRRRLFLQPGMAACIAVAVVAAVDGLSWAYYWGKFGSDGPSQMLERFWRGHSQHPGPAVGLCWLGLVISRRWRPEPTWIDRLGRFLGFLWILTLLCDWRFGRWTFNLTYRLFTNS